MKRNLSPMTLGTVQLGMNYGIANESGKPSLEKSCRFWRRRFGEESIPSIPPAPTAIPRRSSVPF